MSRASSYEAVPLLLDQEPLEQQSQFSTFLNKSCHRSRWKMGASSSIDRTSPEQQELETLAASTGCLPFLKSGFAKISDPHSKAIPHEYLLQSLSLPSLTVNLPSPPIANDFPRLLPHVGSAAAHLLFSAGKDGTDWIAFLRGFNRCCARMPAASSLNLLYRLFSDVCERAGVDCPLIFDPDDADCGKVSGRFGASDLLMLFWLCWVFRQSPRLSKRGGGRPLVLPDLSHLVLSGFVACGEVGDDEGIRDLGGLSCGKSVAVQKLSGWVLTTVPGVADCFSQFFKDKIRAIAVLGDNLNNCVASPSDSSYPNVKEVFLLTFGRAWALSLTQRNTLREELCAASFPGLYSDTLNNLLYRSSTHGKGLSRFWSRVEGYRGPLLFLFSGNSSDSSAGISIERRWVVGVLTEQGFEDRDTFYGSSAHLYAVCPIFRAFSPVGKERNFLYSHQRPTGRVYEASPKSVGLAFGGAIGNERIFIDEDFSKVIIRHHAVDKTYQHGSLIPNQGYLPVEASLVEAEAWGFGGESSKKLQNAFKKREELFTEQRRKVDLKTFGGWEDSPEKMMMDMISDPNRVRREDR
ncbi:hypothetical protein AXF42_Ash018714 [Apostasia shenzhenica]|uniref:TLDc domain-containing protein n=1 Tax=Apostasia shenzhenica TaxID=1088818 RepID=A0A2H9ZZR8_9ASPA|nr:hypothetical protein AXF42_Ash018714 [Apostasia shenzhenica]